MKKAFLLTVCALTLGFSTLRADEGMWMLPWLQKLNIKDMKAKGLKLSASDIYNLNGDALKDAVVLFGGGCTAEIVSAEGLLLTNHHCGYGAIQRLSSVEHDYLQNGYWAMNRSEELPAAGMSVTFIRRIEDVSDRIFPYLSESMSDEVRQKTIQERIGAVIGEALPEKSSCEAMVREFFDGNQYLLFITEKYPDVRFVGAPPSSIGKFGGDTDNWMWPRHTGDFSMFRVYADAQGRPAAYSQDNVPYQAPVHLAVSLKGIKPGDYTMIIGFPGSTERYQTSYEIGQTYRVGNPVRILVRGERQEKMMEDMLADPKIRLQYANKFAGSSNYWKNSIGMNRGIEKLDVLAKKRALEAQFTEWVNADPDRRAQYGDVLPTIEEIVKDRTPRDRHVQYLGEALIRGVELIGMAAPWNGLITRGADSVLKGPDEAKLDGLRQGAAGKYKDYSPSTDRKVSKRMVGILFDSLSAAERPAWLNTQAERFGGDIDRMVDDLFDRSVFASQQSYEQMLKNPDYEQLWNDPALVFFRSLQEALKLPEAEQQRLKDRALRLAKAKRLFLAGLMEMQPDKTFYPDANLTMRLTYGQVLPYRPADGVIYDYYTTLSGVIAKEDPKNPYEFTVPERLKELYRTRDFGPYAEAGDVRVNFLSNNDITGGNSGSPVLNDRGQLLGLAFDGNWEAMSGDIAFEPDLQRTIVVDIRYVLFIIDKYAGASHLLDEMTIVR